MGKKANKLNLIYLAGMALVVVGFFLPLFQILGKQLNGFDFINLDKLNSATLATLLIFAGALVGVVFCFVNSKSSGMIRFLALGASIAGGILVLLLAQDLPFAKVILREFPDRVIKSMLKHTAYGTYIILAGWIVGTVGLLKK